MGNGTCNPGAEASLQCEATINMGDLKKKISGDRFNLFVAVWEGMTAMVGSVLSRRWGKEDV